MTPLESRVQQMAEKFIAEHAGIAERLNQGDTLERHAALADLRNWILRHYEYGDVFWFDRQVMRVEIYRAVNEWDKARQRTGD